MTVCNKHTPSQDSHHPHVSLALTRPKHETIKCSSTFMINSSFLMSVFFSSLRFTGSSGGGTNVIGRFGDFAINRLFTNTFSYVSVGFSPLLELDITAVSGSGSVSPSIS